MGQNSPDRTRAVDGGKQATPLLKRGRRHVEAIPLLKRDLDNEGRLRYE